MKLEDVTAEIRPRSPWESIDLGCALACRHLGAMMKAWMVTVIPLWILLALLLRNHPVWFMVITWWLKPLYDRVPLMVVSRALFGTVPTAMEVLKASPKLFVKRLLFSLVIGRFSPARCLSLPISELEGLRGVEYRQRVNLLERNGGEGATSATFVGLLLEGVVLVGMVFLVLMMVPSEVSERWLSALWEIFTHNDFAELTVGLLWVLAVIRLVSFLLMEPFYVSAGFALYVNSRTLTEGWDIELAFKRLSARLRGLREGSAKGVQLGMALSASLMFCVFGFASESYAGELSPDAHAQEILSEEDFRIHHRVVDVPVEKNRSRSGASSSGLAGFMGLVGHVMFFVILALIIAGLIWLIYRNRHIFIADRSVKDSTARSTVSEVMGMNIEPDSLPDDIAAAARQAWRDGDAQRALSLLYRGSIAWFVHRVQLGIVESDTELDCLRLVRDQADAESAGYFSRLTDVWVLAAYGKVLPEDTAMLELCETWPFSQVRKERRSG